MALIDVIKWEASASELVHKYPVDNLKFGSQLVVYPGQTAVFMKSGKILDLFTAGTYTLSTDNVPLLGAVVNLPFGGDSPFQAQVWFVNQVSLLDCKWGTPAPLQIEDPRYGVIVPVRAYGQYGFHISDPRLFLERFVANMPTFATQKVMDYFKGMILSRLTAIISEALDGGDISVVNINSHLEAIGAKAMEILARAMAPYGVELEMFQVIGVSVDADDESFRRLKETKDSLARINIMGVDKYRLERSFDVLEGVAENPGGLAGVAAGAGAGWGIGRQLGNMMNLNVAGNVPQDIPPLPAEEYFVAEGGEPKGPFGMATLRDGCAAGRYGARTLVWRCGMPEWKRMGELAEFAGMLGAAACPPPIPEI